MKNEWAKYSVCVGGPVARHNRVVGVGGRDRWGHST